MEIQPFPGSPSYVMGQGLGHLRSKGYTFLICTKAPHEEAIGCANVQMCKLSEQLLESLLVNITLHLKIYGFSNIF